MFVCLLVTSVSHAKMALPIKMYGCPGQNLESRRRLCVRGRADLDRPMELCVRLCTYG